MCRKKITAVAESIIKGDINTIEGCRELYGLMYSVNSEYEGLFDVIKGIESQTDHIPLGSARKRCSKSYLSELDNEIQPFLDETRPALILSCKKLIEVFGEKKEGLA